MWFDVDPSRTDLHQSWCDVTCNRYKGSFKFDAAKFGPLASIIAPLQNVEVYMGIK